MIFILKLDLLCAAFAIFFRKAALYRVRPRDKTRLSLSLSGRIFLKFDIRVFFESLSRKFAARYNLARKAGNLHEGRYAF